MATTRTAVEVGRILAEGFHSDPVLGWAFGPVGPRAAKLEAFFAFLAAEVNVPMGTTFIADGGCACWTPPPGTEAWSEPRSSALGALLHATCDADDLARLGALSTAMDAVHPNEPHWYLGTLATVPDRQGRGIGSALLRHTLPLVDGGGFPAYLESTNDRNVALYERHGFSVSGRIELPDGPHLTTMWRPPKFGHLASETDAR